MYTDAQYILDKPFYGLKTRYYHRKLKINVLTITVLFHNILKYRGEKKSANNRYVQNITRK